MIIWHMLTKGEDYIRMRPALLARKFRSIEFKAGLPTQNAKRGAAYDYNILEKRAAELARVEKAEEAFADLTARWRTKAPTKSRVRNKCLYLPDRAFLQHPCRSACPAARDPA